MPLVYLFVTVVVVVVVEWNSVLYLDYTYMFFSSVEEQSCVRQKGILVSEGRVWTVICTGGERISKKKKTTVREDEPEEP